jgi:PIN domain nuclease of toxin-antitoxin system
MKKIILALELLMSYSSINSMEIVEGTLIAGMADALVALDDIKETFAPKQDHAIADPGMQDRFAQFNLRDGQMQPYIAPDGIHIAISDKKNKLHLYTVDKEQYRWTMPYSGWNVTWNRQGTQFYAERALGQDFHYNKTVWDTHGKQVLDLGDPLVGKANFTHDGKYLLEKINDNSVTVIEISSREEHKIDSLDNIHLQDPCSEYIVSRSQKENKTQFYPVAKLKELACIQPVKKPKKSLCAQRDIAGYLETFSSDGSVIVVKQPDKKIALLSRAFEILRTIQLSRPDSPFTQWGSVNNKLLINQKDKGTIYNIQDGSIDSSWENDKTTKGFVSLDFSHSITAKGNNLIFHSRDPKNRVTVTLELDSPVINLQYASPRHIVVEISTEELLIDITNGDTLATSKFLAPPMESKIPFKLHKFFSRNGKYIWYNANPERSLSVRQLPNIT